MLRVFIRDPSIQVRHGRRLPLRLIKSTVMPPRILFPSSLFSPFPQLSEYVADASLKSLSERYVL